MKEGRKKNGPPFGEDQWDEALLNAGVDPSSGYVADIFKPGGWPPENQEPPKTDPEGLEHPPESPPAIKHEGAPQSPDSDKQKPSFMTTSSDK